MVAPTAGMYCVCDKGGQTRGNVASGHDYGIALCVPSGICGWGWGGGRRGDHGMVETPSAWPQQMHWTRELPQQAIHVTGSKTRCFALLLRLSGGVTGLSVGRLLGLLP